jgi:hypothetical protein
MSSRNKKKKKGSRKPKANAVQRKRRARHSPTTSRLVTRSASAPLANQPPERARVAAEPLEDATWWADFWPFAAESVPAEDANEDSSDAEPTTSDVPRMPTETPVRRVPVRSGRRDMDREVRQSLPNRLTGRVAELGVQVGLALLVAALAVVAVLGWRAFERGSGESAHLTHATTYAAPVQLHRDTSFVRSRLLPSGDIEVTHWIRSRHFLMTVSLAIPSVPGLAPGAVRVRDLVVAGDGSLVPVTTRIGTEANTTISLPPTHRLYLRYRLSGAVEIAGGPHDRALARVTSLDVSTAGRLTSTTRTVVGARILALACSPMGSSQASTPCGTVVHGKWTVNLGAARQKSRVMAQFNLR